MVSQAVVATIAASCLHQGFVSRGGVRFEECGFSYQGPAHIAVGCGSHDLVREHAVYPVIPHGDALRNGLDLGLRDFVV